MTENTKKVCYSLLRELNCGRDEVDIFYVAYAASLSYDKAFEAMDEIISLGGAKRLDIKSYKLFDIRAVLDGPEKEEQPVVITDEGPVYDRNRIKKIISGAEARKKTLEEKKREIEETFGNDEDFFKLRQMRKEAEANIRAEEKRAASALIAAIEEIKQSRIKEATYYPSGQFAKKYINCARNNLIWDKTEGNIYVYVDKLFYSTGEQVRFRLVHYGSFAYLGDDRFLVRKISRLKGMATSDAEKRIKLLLKTSDIGMSVFELKASATEKTALADYFKLYFFIQSVLDALI